MEKSPIIEKSERENAGAMASNRFSYQINWGICQLLRLHEESDNPYYLVMEKHDDALICDDLIKPTTIEFYQVKTKRGSNWKLATLIRGKTDSMCILGKMYNSREKFGLLAKKLSFRTNTYFEIKGTNNKSYKTVDSFRYSELNDFDQKRFTKAIENDCVTHPGDDFDEIYEFKKDSLDINNHCDTTIGKVSNFFDRHLDESFRGMAYVFIAGEVSRKNNYEGTVRTTLELEKLKSVSRAEFDEWLSHCVRTIKSSDGTMQILNSELMKTSESFTDRKAIQRNAKEYKLKLKTRDRVIRKLRNIILEEEANAKGATVIDTAENLYNLILPKIGFVDYLGKKKILSSIMYELCR
jgi:hypothetical protein